VALSAAGGHARAWLLDTVTPSLVVVFAGLEAFDLPLGLQLAVAAAAALLFAAASRVAEEGDRRYLPLPSGAGAVALIAWLAFAVACCFAGRLPVDVFNWLA
jgi:hypothetical protein